MSLSFSVSLFLCFYLLFLMILFDMSFSTLANTKKWSKSERKRWKFVEARLKLENSATNSWGGQGRGGGGGGGGGGGSSGGGRGGRGGEQGGI